MRESGFINAPMSIMLDGVRAAAAWVVLIGHAVQLQLYTGPWPYSTMLQRNAVVVFFVLSGLVITHSVRAGRPSPRDYITARAVRILPVTIFAVAFSAAAGALAGYLGFATPTAFAQQASLDMQSVLLPLLFLSEAGPGHGAGPPWNPAYWSVVYEVWFYALFGAALFLRGWGRLLALALLAAGAGLKVLLLLPVWLMGAALARWGRAQSVSPAAGLACLIAGLSLVPLANHFAIPGSAWMISNSGLDYTWFMYSNFALTDWLIGVGVVMQFIGLRPLAEGRAQLLRRWQGPIRRAANSSFTLYLLHFPILGLLAASGIGAGGNPLLFMLILAGVIALCDQIARLTEHRRHAIRAWIERRGPVAGRAVVSG